MAFTQTECLKYLNQLLTPESFEDYAPNGLQVEGKNELKVLAFAVSATQDSIQKAIELQCDALVVHHGIFWKHQGARTLTGAWGERARALIKNDLNLFAYHLPLDAHPIVGNAASLAKKLDLTNLTPFALYKRQPLGLKGSFQTPIKANLLQKKIETLLGKSIILATPNAENEIKSLGIITGGANNEWAKALDDGLDAYLTGEISEYNWHDTIEAGIHYFACGHHATEKYGIQSLMKKMKEDYPALHVHFIDSENPI